MDWDNRDSGAPRVWCNKLEYLKLCYHSLDERETALATFTTKVVAGHHNEDKCLSATTQNWKTWEINDILWHWEHDFDFYLNITGKNLKTCNNEHLRAMIIMRLRIRPVAHGGLSSPLDDGSGYVTHRYASHENDITETKIMPCW
jgi:hypothetical protein